jgi:hypothetical protein
MKSKLLFLSALYRVNISRFISIFLLSRHICPLVDNVQVGHHVIIPSCDNSSRHYLLAGNAIKPLGRVLSGMIFCSSALAFFSIPFNTRKMMIEIESYEFSTFIVIESKNPME